MTKIPWLIYVLAGVLAFGITIYFTPLIRDAALRFGIVDVPDGRLKRHEGPVPYLGGLAVYLGFLVAVSVMLQWDEKVMGVLLGGTLILLLGLMDDLGRLSPAVKLGFQLLAALVLVKSGIRMEIIFLPDWVEIPLSVFWIVAVINAFNIIDVMDGLSAGVAAIGCMALFVVSLINGRPSIALMAISLTGALAGFVRFNFHPARIYLGDAGSLLIGCVIASLTLIGSYTLKNTVSLLVPVVILGVPLFDMAFVMYIRWRRGMPIFLGSPDHFALRLRKWRLNVKQTVICSYCMAALLSCLAILMMYLSDLGALCIVVGIVIMALCIGAFLRRIDMSM